MSERKIAEIKFRITPSEKARWQAKAAEEQIGLSELIRRAMHLELNPVLFVKRSWDASPQEDVRSVGTSDEVGDLRNVERHSWSWEAQRDA